LKSLARGIAAQSTTAAGGSKDDDAGDAGLFRAAVGDVKQLAPNGRADERAVLAAKTHAHRRVAARPRTAPAAEFELLPDTVSEQEVVGGADPLAFRRPGVRDQVMRRLRRGLYPVEDELDLHGLNQSAARDSLSEFLEFSRSAALRCVRIVHGKGYRSGARGPILKIAVNAWLRRHPDVMAFTSARAIDGGTGAVYVLLRA
jgi:DNA-nicking Smr family endonuclease